MEASDILYHRGTKEGFVGQARNSSQGYNIPVLPHPCPSIPHIGKTLMTHELLALLGETRKKALAHAANKTDEGLVHRCSVALEIAVLDLAHENITEDQEKQKELQCAAADAFRLLRALPLPATPLDAGIFLLKAGSFAMLGDKSADASIWMKEIPWPDLPVNSDDWGERTWATVVDAWLRLICQDDEWSDRGEIPERISSLRSAQSAFEKKYLDEKEPRYAKGTALELIGLYHLAKAAEILACHITDGSIEEKYQTHQLLGRHFEHILDVCKHGRMLYLEPLSRLLYACTSKMTKNASQPSILYRDVS